jgi:DNA-binding protein H-NS
MDNSNDTDRTNVQELTIDLLTEIRDKLSSLESEQWGQRKQLEQLTVDVNVIHKFQTSFTERLSLVERFCVEQPLRSTPAPRPTDGRGKSR